MTLLDNLWQLHAACILTCTRSTQHHASCVVPSPCLHRCRHFGVRDLHFNIMLLHRSEALWRWIILRYVSFVSHATFRILIDLLMDDKFRDLFYIQYFFSFYHYCRFRHAFLDADVHCHIIGFPQFTLTVCSFSFLDYFESARGIAISSS